MYLVDFFKRMTRKSNIPVLIYLVLNIFVITGIVSFILGGGVLPFWQCFLIAIVLYSFSLLIALSPIGEWVLRLQTGCRKIKRVEQINFIEPIGFVKITVFTSFSRYKNILIHSFLNFFNFFLLL